MSGKHSLSVMPTFEFIQVPQMGRKCALNINELERTLKQRISFQLLSIFVSIPSNVILLPSPIVDDEMLPTIINPTKD